MFTILSMCNSLKFIQNEPVAIYKFLNTTTWESLRKYTHFLMFWKASENYSFRIVFCLLTFRTSVESLKHVVILTCGTLPTDSYRGYFLIYWWPSTWNSLRMRINEYGGDSLQLLRNRSLLYQNEVLYELL